MSTRPSLPARLRAARTALRTGTVPVIESDAPLQLRGVHGNLLASTTGVWAWYALGARQYFYRTTSHREALRSLSMARWADLLGHRIHLRITSHPYPVGAWAQHFRAKHPAASRLPDPAHGETFDDMVDAMQARMVALGLTTPTAYLGVRLSRRTVSHSDLVKIAAAAMTGEKIPKRLSEITDEYRRVSSVMARPGFDAQALTAGALAWLINSSLTPGIPVPQIKLNAATSGYDEHTVDEIGASVRSSADPYAPAVAITAPRGGQLVTVHAATVSLARVPERDIESPRIPLFAWIATLDQPVQVSAVMDVRDGAAMAEEATKARENIDQQIDHMVETKRKPPRALLRAKRDAARIEDERSHPLETVRVRVEGHVRFQVIGLTADQAVERRDDLVRSFTAGQAGVVMTHHHQWASYREFTPGEKIANHGFVRTIPNALWAAWEPAADVTVGDGSGPYRGFTTRTGHSAFLYDPQASTRAGRSGLTLVQAGLGGGKSYLQAGTFETEVRLGHRSGAIDPAGRLRDILRLEHLRGQVRDLDLSAASSGLFIPYRQIPEPRRADYADPPAQAFRSRAEHEAAVARIRDEYAKAVDAASDERLMRTTEMLLGRLPYGHAENPDVQAAVEAAVNSVGGAYDTDPWAVVAALENGETDIEHRVAQMLTASAGVAGGRLILPPKTWREPVTDILASSILITARNMPLPQPGTHPSRWTPGERNTAQLLKAAGWFLTSMMYSGNDPKYILLEEAGDIGADDSFRAFAERGSLHTRKSQTTISLSLQDSLQGVKVVPNLHAFLGDRFIGRMDAAAAPAACTLAGIPEHYAQVLPSLTAGEFLVAGHDGRIQTVRIDSEYRDALHRLLLTNPGTHAPGVDPRDVRDYTPTAQEVMA